MCIRDRCSALSVVYTEEGIFEKYLFLPANPNLVLMDTDIITKSPVRLTAVSYTHLDVYKRQQ